MSGTQDIVVAGGVEVMSLVPIMSSTTVGTENGLGSPWEAVGFKERFGDSEVSQFNGASLMARRYELSREEMDAFAAESHRRAVLAWKEGRFSDEVAPVNGLDHDEGPRPDTSVEVLATLKSLPGFPELTAGLASQISDGASAVMVASDRAVEEHGLKVLARIVDVVGVGTDPIEMLAGPIPATEMILRRNELSIDDIDLFEVNEAFAPVVLGWAKATGAPLEKTNVNGGAIALGHPLGATGTKLATSITYALLHQELDRGLIAICEGGGTANAMLIERVA
jgi:acetyl-CoA C-acetyltransferase